MSRAGAGQSGSFALSLAAFAAQANEAIDASVREIIIEIGNSLIRCRLWAIRRFGLKML